jgi:hypothetical protein
VEVQERRQELWEHMTQDAVEVVDQYAWAIPDERALRVLAYVSPIVEVGAGAGVSHHHCMRCHSSRRLGTHCVGG